MSTNKRGTRYGEEFKRTLVNLYQNGGKSQAALCKEYGVSINALGRWIKQYSTVEVDDGEVLTALQVKELQKRNAQLEEENYSAITSNTSSSYSLHNQSHFSTLGLLHKNCFSETAPKALPYVNHQIPNVMYL